MPETIAVIDVETTGLFPHRNDRILEVAAVVVDSQGKLVREFVSLTNPERDIGPSRIHGLTSEDLLDAPRFAEIAASLFECLDGARAIAAHNIRFDFRFLEAELARFGCTMPQCHRLCTMQLAGGGTLADCCADFGVSMEGEPHSALADARSAAHLLVSVLADDAELARELGTLPPVRWPHVKHISGRTLTRDESRRRAAEPPTYLRQLLEKAADNLVPCADESAVLAYSAILTRALEDRVIDESEGRALVEVATQWGLDQTQIIAAHREFVAQLAAVAVADGVVTDTERRDLLLVARLLGQDQETLNRVLNEAANKVAAIPAEVGMRADSDAQLTGKSVCFTGELRSHHDGEAISRNTAELLATNAGLTIARSVTKKLDVLVVADPHTQSGKAAKAKRYGTRILHEPVFWRAIGVEVE